MYDTTFLLLGCLLQANATSSLTALTIEEIMQLSQDSILKKYTTVYYNLKTLESFGFVTTGITRGRRYTYFVTKNGAEWFNMQ